ncbi:hypothetical protein ACIRNU_34740 [Streptomyces rochei]|uniref:hypothetical protein n=1 Tax=Streptomyces rochei TaxID=1928 RepID=UPI003816974E
MDLNRSPSQIARSAAEEIRALNHRTLSPKVYTEPADLANTADGIVTLLERLPQTLKQLRGGLRMLEEVMEIRTDNGQEPHVAVGLASSHLLVAEDDIESVITALRRARAELSHMAGPWPEGDEDEEE